MLEGQDKGGALSEWTMSESPASLLSWLCQQNDSHNQLIAKLRLLVLFYRLAFELLTVLCRHLSSRTIKVTEY